MEAVPTWALMMKVLPTPQEVKRVLVGSRQSKKRLTSVVSLCFQEKPKAISKERRVWYEHTFTWTREGPVDDDMRRLMAETPGKA